MMHSIVNGYIKNSNKKRNVYSFCAIFVSKLKHVVRNEEEYVEKINLPSLAQ